MSIGRLLAAAVVLALGYWIVTKSGLLTHAASENAGSQTPIEKARAVARRSSDRSAQTQGAQREADAPVPSGTITENMTPDQVRSLLGPPSDIRTETTDNGVHREKWTYAAVGKTVVFENGIVVSVE